MNPSFKVPADYFYALAAYMPPQVTPEQRYRMACLQDEERVLSELSTARDNGVIDETPGGINRAQAARRLRALGIGLLESAIPECPLQAPSPEHNLVDNWLQYTDSDIAVFWTGATPPPPDPADPAAHLAFVLCAVTRNHDPLIQAISAELAPANVDDLAAITANEWEEFFLPEGLDPRTHLLPAFTEPGSPQERVAAFIRHLQKFFEVELVPIDAPAPTVGAPPILGRAKSDLIETFVLHYNAHAGGNLVFGTGLVEAHFQAALNNVFPDDPQARGWLEQAIRTIDELYAIADIGVSDELRFSIVEGLYARGFASRESVQEMAVGDFREALIGTVAFDHAAAIHAKAGGGAAPVAGESEEFRPINPDGLLANCIPPPHLSPLGPVAYLHDALRVSRASTCDDPFPPTDTVIEDGVVVSGGTISDHLAGRCGSPGDLLVTRTNLETPLPLIDLVNECLEAVTASLPALPVAHVHNTAGDKLADHVLCRIGKQPAPGDEFCHDPVVLFETLPEHSSPATPVAQPGAYDKLKNDFTAPVLPYSQPLDICRSYLRYLDTSRYDTMRRFRKDITEFVLDPAGEPAQFQRHLWRYPVRIEIAREYLRITPEEYDLLFTQAIANVPTPGQLLLREVYGFESHTIDGDVWTQVIVKVSEFLKRTGLDYCEFIELWRSEFVEFHREGEDREFPDCEPCYLDKDEIVFDNPSSKLEALTQLAVFIRLWRKLQGVEGAKYTFTELRDICEVLQLFKAGDINPDFIRQLAAFQMLRDDFGLTLTDEADDQPGVGADRTHLLALWVGDTARKWNWAVDHLLDGIQQHALREHECACRPPEFIKLLAENMDPLSDLAGFDPASPDHSWHAHPTHTLRFAEVLSKIYASDFGVGEILFLFTVSDHLRGDDPFPLQPKNEALDSPIGFPDDEKEHSLLALRKRLLDIAVSEEEVRSWSWTRIDTALREEFGYSPAAGEPDALVSLGEHFFPTILEASGSQVEPLKRQYRVDLAGTPAPMWNTPPEGPFRYDSGAGQLWTELPLSDEAVLAKLSRIRQLKAEERRAVRELYFLPRVDLAPFAFIFPTLGHAEEQLIQEPDEDKRWAYFQEQFALCYVRCRVIAEHLASHVAEITGTENIENGNLAWQLLKHLYADENMAKAPWESDTGEVPEVTWTPPPNGGAFAALLGLNGTGLLGEFMPEDKDNELSWEDDTLIWDDDKLVWREVRGPMEAFGPEENAWNSPVSTVLPSMTLTFSLEQQRFATVRNGFALSNPDGEPLGGAQGFAVRWRGALLIENEGSYSFWAGAPTPDGEEPDFEGAEDARWRIMLKRGQRTWVLLSHQWPDVSAPAACSAPLPIKRGVYELIVEFIDPHPPFSRPEEVCPQTTGFQVKYCGLDSEDRIVAIPLDKLFRDRKDQTLAHRIILEDDDAVDAAYKHFLERHFTSSLRDIRRTYQRAFKALLFAHRFGLSAKPVADDQQSEIGYMLKHAEDFAGRSYFEDGGAFSTHLANFDFNFLPLLDNYYSPVTAEDQRVEPSVKRRQALFDWWERVFDYTTVRREAQTAPERPVWLLFHEAAERHPDRPAHLVRHMGIDFRHAELLLLYYKGFSVQSEDLEDERWGMRVWQGEKWIRALLFHFAVEDIRDARPDRWASDDPSVVEAGETESGNGNLTKFVRNGSFENGEPRRYLDVKGLNDGLRERARTGLLAYLYGMNRVSLPWGGHAQRPKELSELLLMDVEAGLCQKASRIEKAITSVQTYIQRARLGLEPDFIVSEQFVLLWDRRFASFHIWVACKRRDIYRENWIDWDELGKARRTEAFRFLESELRRATLTVPVPGGLEYWPDQRPPEHPGLTPLQSREPALIQQLLRPPEGFNLLGTPERHARPSWLAALRGDEAILESPELEEPGIGSKLPFWIQAAIRLGVRFLRIAAAGLPPASSSCDLRDPNAPVGCCIECGKPHPPVVDEYYFWLFDTRHYTERSQDADWGVNPDNVDEGSVSDWHRPEELPGLLHWPPEPMVHLAWCRVHNGEFQQPRRSFVGVRIAGNSTPQLEFLGREGDSLNFEVIGGVLPPGYTAPPSPGFRYDLAPDSAIVVPLVAEPPPPEGGPGELPAYPFFAYVVAGAQLMPPSLFSPAVSVAGWLRAHCRFEAALKWYECFYNPLTGDSTWCAREQREEDEDESNVCCSSIVLDPVARNRSITLHYLETLLEWADALMRRNSPEAFHQARQILNTAAKILGDHPQTVMNVDDTTDPKTVAAFVPLFAGLNPRLMALYERIDDRFSLIHACLNARRLRNGRPNKDMPYWGNSPLRNGWQTTAEVCPDEEDWCYLQSCYRFVFLVQKAQELADQVRALGAALLAAFEKGDTEYLASLRATHERQLLNLALDVRQNQWREADWQVQALGKTKEIAQTRLRYFETLVANGLIGEELQYQVLTGVALGLRATGNISEGIAQAMGVTPDMWMGIAGIAGTPLQFNQIPIGSKLAGVFSTIARISIGVADINSMTGSLRLTEGGWVRREDEWRHQVEVLGIEIEQIERQILAAERRRNIALRELNNHQRQMEQSAEVHDFLRDKFTNHALYLWLQQETAALHHQMYELALHTARQTESAFNYERGYTARRFLPEETWDNLHEGLLAGERLLLAARQMEKAYLDENCREYELTKHISLRMHFPMQFLQLKVTGYCEIEIPEWMFDLDYPGQYLRRIKNVSLSLPCVVGPYTGVHCRLTILSSTTRVDPRLGEPPVLCCEDKRPSNGYEALPDDPRFVKQYAATEAIATSSGQNDAGMFELNFRDERYLPFEFSGAVGRWRIELPQENNQFDLDTLSDVIMHLNYMSREGGDVLRQAANEIAQQRLPGDGWRFFDVKHEIPEAWRRFQKVEAAELPPRQLPLRLGRNMFAFLPGQRGLWITRIVLLFEVYQAEPPASHIVEFVVDTDNPATAEYEPDCKPLQVKCMASAEWPGLYHGVLDVRFGPLSDNADDLGSFAFPSEIVDVSRVYLFCSYETKFLQ